MEFDIVFEKQKEGGYTVYVPALPGCISEGENKKDAFRNIKEAIEIYVDEMEKSDIRKIVKSVSVEKMKVGI